MENGKHVKAMRREKKRRPKMAVHGAGVKSRPAGGILKYARKRFFLYFVPLVFLTFGSGIYAQSEPPPRLFIISPAPGEVIVGTDVKVIIRLPAGVTLDDYHVHLWLDTLSAHDNELAVSLEEIPEHTYSNVFSGLHKLYAEAYRDDHTPVDRKMFAEVEFETGGEEIKPAPAKDGQQEAPPEGAGGQFIPQGSGNTLFALILIAIFIGLLWYIFGRQRRR